MKFTENEMEKIKARFWCKVNKTETCWEWTGYIDKAGYGRFALLKRSMLSHRVSMWFEKKQNLE